MNDPTAPVRIRDAALGDAEILADYNARLAEETEHLRLDPAVVRRGVARVLGDASKGRYFVAEVSGPKVGPSAQALPAGSGDVVGCTMVTYEWSDWRDAYLWWIQSVYVRAGWRRRGVFRALYGHVRQAALDAGAGGLRLYVERENVAAQRTYESLGMHIAPYAMMAEMFDGRAGESSSIE